MNKKTINMILLIAMAVLLVWGVIAAVIATTALDPKISSASYSKSGKSYVSQSSYDYQDDNVKHMYAVSPKKTEYISQSQLYNRRLKNLKLWRDYYNKQYKKDKTESNKAAYEDALEDYKVGKAAVDAYNKLLFTTSIETFFGYFSIAAILGVGFLLYNKLDKKEE